jgi:hypothetical protein
MSMPGDRDNITPAAALILMVSTGEPEQSVALSTPGRQWHRADIMVPSAADLTVAPPVAEVPSTVVVAEVAFTVAVVVATVADAKS